MSEQEHGHEHEPGHEHVVPMKVYTAIFVMLLLLTLVTLDIAFYNFGMLNIGIALAVATTKAVLVILFFMHVRYSPPLTAVFAGVGFVYLFILLFFTLSDFLTRGWL
jgi:cytochrome c oxidase subunit IV